MRDVAHRRRSGEALISEQRLVPAEHEHRPATMNIGATTRRSRRRRRRASCLRTSGR
jgi:hypothetical protein